MDECRLKFTVRRGSITRETVISDDAVHHAFAHALTSRPLDDEADPRRWLIIGPDHAGRLLELVLLVFDSGREIIIHAMKARAQYLG